MKENLITRAPAAAGEGHLRKHWSNERAYRTGTGLARIVFWLCFVALLLNLKFAGLAEQLADIALLIGCALSLYLTRRRLPERSFVWWPVYVGYIIAIIPSTYLSGGLYSPWLGMYLVVLAILTSVVQSKLTPWANFFITTIYLAIWVGVHYVIPQPGASVYLSQFPPHFMFFGILICLTGTCYGLNKLLNTERELTLEIEERYAELFEARANLLREESANQAKSTFLANISHELRTPLGAVLGYANLIQDKAATPEEKNLFAQTIERNGQQLARLVDDLLDLSKIEAGRIELEKIECRTAELVSEVANLLDINAKKKNIKFDIVYENPIPELICTDPVRFKQILTNIIGNALKFTLEGNILVKLSYSQETSRLQISVRDTGRGISPLEKEKLFKPFSQADASMTRRYGGTGLGLNFSRELSRLLGGDLTLTWSEIGIGSEFTIELPLEVPSGSKMVEAYIDPLRRMSRPVVVAPHYNFEGVKVLVVDDAPENRDIVQRYLMPTGATVDVASDGNECISKVEKNPYNIVLMDIQMPGLDGLQATSILRQKHFNGPIIAVTAHAMREDRDRCIEAGCNSHIAKPLKKNELMEIIEKYRQPTFSPSLESL